MTRAELIQAMLDAGYEQYHKSALTPEHKGFTAGFRKAYGGHVFFGTFYVHMPDKSYVKPTEHTYQEIWEVISKQKPNKLKTYNSYLDLWEK